MAQPQPEVGSTANSYVVLAKLATGGMAEIFLARNASGAGIERYVVLKRVLRHRANDASFVQMFLDEARLAAHLQHPNIAQVYDTGVLGDSYFFTMEYVHGETVREILHRTYALKQAIPIGVVLAVIAGAAAGLHHAHERLGMDGRPLGIVHRDVSPSNLMVSFEGNVKILDFGVAKASHRSTETQSGTVKGKIAYLSPEQCRGRAIDRRSDLFSLGIVMWEMLVGDRLFKKTTDYENMEAIVQGPTPPAPSARRPGVPKEIDAIVGKLLQRQPDDRFQTADELLDAIEQIAVKIGTALSAASVGRFLRELFGQRPEPWIEMAARDARPEPVTVTAAPIAGGAELERADDVDSQLASVPELSTHSHSTPLATPRAPSSPSLSVVRDEPRDTDATTPSGTQVPSALAHSSADIAALPAAPRKSLAMWIVAGAVALALAVTIYVATSGGTPGTHASAPAANIAKDAANVASAPIDPPPAPVAPSPAPSPPVAAPPVEPAPPPVEHAHAPPRAHAPAPHVAPPPHEPPHEPAHEAPAPDDITSLYRADKYADVVAACGNAKLAAANALNCTLAACHVRDVAKAKHWLSLVTPGKQAGVAGACQTMGAQLETPKPKQPDCDADPMSCRR